MAILADEKNTRVLEHQKRVARSLAAKELAKSEELAAKIKEHKLDFKRESGDGGKLFGSVTVRDIANALAEHGIDVSTKRIGLEAPLKETGCHEIEISLNRGVVATVTVFVSAS